MTLVLQCSLEDISRHFRRHIWDRSAAAALELRPNALTRIQLVHKIRLLDLKQTLF